MIALLLLVGCGLDPAAVAKGMGSGNLVVREDMVIAARQVDDPAVVEALKNALADPAPRVRSEAAESLAWLGHAEVTPQIVPLLDDAEPMVRRAAVEALGRLKDPAAVEPLIAYLERRPDDAVPLDAIWALGNLADARALPALSALREDPDAFVRYHATWALREIGDRGVGSPSGAPASGDAGSADEPAANPKKEGDSAPPEAPTAGGQEDLPPPKVVPWPGG